MCGAWAVSGVTRTGADQVRPPSAEYVSQPMSAAAVWVSQVTYRFPAASALISPSIHQSGRATVPLAGHSASGDAGQCVRSGEEVKNSYPGRTASVRWLVGWPS
ncbi:MAG TPA: hypothetical protein VF070_03010 [Streptosporangiaceae bacterium]